MNEYRKAIAGALFGVGGGLITAGADGAITTTELVVALGLGLVTGAGVFYTPNKTYTSAPVVEIREDA